MPLRVIGGSAGGIELRQPRGATRPTSARLREALFAILEAADLLRSPVLDLYAGSGALGIEALSRGVAQCTFVEADRRACDIIKHNLEHARLTGGTVVRGRVGGWRADPETPVSLVIADPPYDDPASWSSIEASVQDALTADATIVVEHAARQAPPAELAGRPLWRDRRHGEGAVAIYRAESATREDDSE
jgi:16S rRNA (guanine966-N2)-methyltransferase